MLKGPGEGAMSTILDIIKVFISNIFYDIAFLAIVAGILNIFFSGLALGIGIIVSGILVISIISMLDGWDKKLREFHVSTKKAPRAGFGL